jgi:hypothetical protein
VSDDARLLPGFGLAGYRSFFDDVRLFAPLGKITLLAGQNNAGKSNVLRFAHLFLTERPPALEPLDEPRLPDDVPYGNPLRLAVARTVTAQDAEALLPTSADNSVEMVALAHLLDSAPVRGEAPSSLSNDRGTVRRDPDALVWLVYTMGPPARDGADRWQLDPDWLQRVAAALEATGQLREMNPLAGAIGSTIYSDNSLNIQGALSRLSPLSGLPKVKSVEAFRQIGANGSDDFTPSGVDLVTALRDLQHPGPLAQADKKKFRAINRFLQTVLGDKTAELEIHGHPGELLVNRNGVVLPLKGSLGTGVHQVVILAAVATLFENTLLCVEEPEVHLHPLLQRKLIDYLARETTNQYLIATHSAHMLDHATGSAVYHLQPGPDGTRAERADTSEALADICFDLGYRPSDLLQANAVIWVEGPSDRLYLRHWIHLLDKSLHEHIHYSIMFYGGRLLNHLTSLDDALADDLIRLRRLNRHLAIVIDSDKDAQSKRINATKRRVVNEFKAERGDGLAWVTAGRTIENYVPADLLNEAVKAAHPNAKPAYAGERYETPLPTGGKVRYDKVEVAHKVCERWTADTPMLWDLRKDLDRVVRFIRDANGLE